jgi:hypothetical protein
MVAHGREAKESLSGKLMISKYLKMMGNRHAKRNGLKILRALLIHGFALSPNMVLKLNIFCHCMSLSKDINIIEIKSKLGFVPFLTACLHRGEIFEDHKEEITRIFDTA